MFRTFVKSVLVFGGLLVSGSLFAEGIEGPWLVEAKDAIVSVYKCAPNSDKYCGSLTWLSEPNYPANDDKGMAGKPRVDRENPDPNLRSRPIVGLFMMWGFTKTADGKQYTGGSIYNSRNGKTYSGTITVVNDNTISLKGGYNIGFMLISESQVWTRAQ